MSGTREQNFKMARFAEGAERYDDMATYMKRVLEMGSAGLDATERDCLIVAYKNSSSERRRAIGAIDRIAEGMPADMQNAVGQYRTKILAELSSICCEFVDLVEKNLLPKASDVEEQVLYLTKLGDFYRYLAPYAEPGGKGPKEAGEAYSKAMDLAVGLPADNSTRLGAALNQSVCTHEVLGQRDEAVQMLKALLASLDGKDSPEVAMYKELVQENLKLWTSGDPTDGTMVEDM